MQPHLFPELSGNLLPFGGEAVLYPGVFDEEESDLLYALLQKEIAWRQEPIKLFGKTIMQPRLTACYGDKAVGYSGIVMDVHPWTSLLNGIKNRVEAVAGTVFNSVLLNNYRDGKDSMGWHRDNEQELGCNPVIASVTFGAERKFLLRTYADKDHTISVTLTHGSLLLMQGECQHVWEHSVPKVKMARPRINLTFRRIC